MKRRELFGSLASAFKPKQEALIRPSYFQDESAFDKECHQCDSMCATVCEEQIIEIAEDKTPYLVFQQSGCTYCDECAIACEPGVLHVDYRSDIHAMFEINVVKCMSWHNTMCFSCKDPCLDDAIIFDGVFRPQIDMSKCTSCGFCVKVCPTDAINFQKIEVEKYE
ncbi:MAG: ferredoxin-type protein NapF [Campylobacterota bacterium]|nr:ferredoxin-type protein NapF [Campylobacterota bacterium]